MPDIQEAITDAGCFNAVLPQTLLAIIANATTIMAGTSTDVATAVEDASCWTCLNSNQLLAVIANNINVLAGGGGGGGGATQVFPLAGAAVPVTVPTGGGIAYNEIGQVWIYTAGAWSLVLS